MFKFDRRLSSYVADTPVKIGHDLLDTLFIIANYAFYDFCYCDTKDVNKTSVRCGEGGALGRCHLISLKIFEK